MREGRGCEERFHSLPSPRPARNGQGRRWPVGEGMVWQVASHLLDLFLHHLDLVLSRFYLLFQLLYFVVKHKLEFL